VIPPFFYLGALIIVLPLLLFVFPLKSHALDEGGGTTGIDYRSIGRETSSSDLNEYDLNYHLDTWQTLPNTGRLLLWLDWTDAKDGSERNRLGRGTLALEEFRFNDFILGGLIGDSILYLSSLPEKFANATYPEVYFRGGRLNFSSKMFEGELFGGKVARLEGLLGTFYNITDESLYGFKTRFRPISPLLIGGGLIYTRNEVDSADRPVTRQNTILLLDSELQVLNEMKWVGEFRQSDFQGNQLTPGSRDYLVRFGPIVNTERFRVEANFRRIGTDYRFVSDASQSETDQEGFFLLTEYRPSNSVVLFGTGDRYRNNVSERTLLSTTDTQRGLLGVSLYSPQYPSFFVSFDMTDQKPRSGLPLPSEGPFPVDSLSSTLYSEVRYQVKEFNPYLRYRRFDYHDHVFSRNDVLQNVITLGLRRDLKIGSSFYVEGELDRNEFPGNEKEERLSGKVGFNYSPSPRFSCWGETIYSKLKDRGEQGRMNRFEGAIGLSYELPWGIQLYGDVRYDTTLHAERDEMMSKGIQATFRVMKSFQWGAREKVAGLAPGIETRGYGSIEGVVFNDINRNGRQESGEEGIKGITISMEDGSLAKTDDKGFYRFPRVEAGSHFMTLDVKRIPAEYNIISPEKRTAEIKLRETLRVNFQLIKAGSIEGRVVHDTNGDGRIDSTEKGLADVLVILEGGEINTYTDEEGKFIFENVLPGEYRLKVDSSTLPEGAVFMSPSEIRIEVPVGGGLTDKNFLIHVKPRPILIGPPKQ
jgi:hypothetical protein